MKVFPKVPPTYLATGLTFPFHTFTLLSLISRAKIGVTNDGAHNFHIR